MGERKGKLVFFKHLYCFSTVHVHVGPVSEKKDGDRNLNLNYILQHYIIMFKYSFTRNILNEEKNAQY